MAVIISFAIQKGGVGKTTSVITTATALGTMGKHVLVVDLDAQHNASTTLGLIDPNEQAKTVRELFTERDHFFSDCIAKTKYKNVDLIPSTIDLFITSDVLSNDPRGLMGLKSKLDDKCRNNYDYILIDCPPSPGGPFVNNALCLSNYYIMPIEAESKYALKGVQQFQEVVESIQDTINPKLQLLGVLITMYNPRTSVSKAMAESLVHYFGEKNVFKTKIRRTTAISKAHLSDMTIIDFDRKSSAAKDYLGFAKELEECLKDTKI